MGLFDKIKKVFVSKEKEDKVYDEGLKKSRNEFVSQLSNLSKKYKNISEDYFEELENILITFFILPLLSILIITYFFNISKYLLMFYKINTFTY